MRKYKYLILKLFIQPSVLTPFNITALSPTLCNCPFLRLSCHECPCCQQPHYVTCNDSTLTTLDRPDPSRKYLPYPPVPFPPDYNRRWPSRRTTASPTWLSTDLRDGNQALVNPMTNATKLKLFRLVSIPRCPTLPDNPQRTCPNRLQRN